MPFTSPYPSLSIPESNVLSYLFPEGEEPYDEPIWLDSKNESNNLSPKALLHWVRRLSFGLERIGLKKGDVVMIYTPNHIFVPVSYLGIVGAGCIFSGANPAYTIPGGSIFILYSLQGREADIEPRACAPNTKHNGESDPRSPQTSPNGTYSRWKGRIPDFAHLSVLRLSKPNTRWHCGLAVLHWH